MDRYTRIADKIVMGASNKDRNVSDLVDGARRVRGDIQKAYKDLLKLGRKVKYIEPVGPLVSDAINGILEAEMAVKAVVDAGNEWAQSRMAKRQGEENE